MGTQPHHPASAVHNRGTNCNMCSTASVCLMGHQYMAAHALLLADAVAAPRKWLRMEGYVFWRATTHCSRPPRFADLCEASCLAEQQLQHLQWRRLRGVPSADGLLASSPESTAMQGYLYLAAQKMRIMPWMTAIAMEFRPSFAVQLSTEHHCWMSSDKPMSVTKAYLATVEVLLTKITVARVGDISKANTHAGP